MRSLVRFLLIVLGFLGLADCLAIAGTLIFSDGQCGGFGTCDRVLNSSYATLLGYSLWQFGIVFYLVYLSVLLVALLRGRNRLLLFCLFWLLGGTLFSGYLIYLQAFKIQAWCPFCLLSAGIQLLSFLGCLYLWKRHPSEKERAPLTELMKELGATLVIAILVMIGIFQGAEHVKENHRSDLEPGDQDRLVARLGTREVKLSDFSEYMTLKHEFEQFIWAKAEDWYRVELLSFAAEEKGFATATEFVHQRYTEAGGLIDIGPEETRKRFANLKKEYQEKGGEMPSDDWLFDELQRRYQVLYDEFVENLTDEMEDEFKVSYLLRPSVVDLQIDEEFMPVLGPADAPIQIIEVSDFHCSHCRKMHQSLEDLVEEIGQDQIRIGYVNHYWEALPEGMSAEPATLTMRAAFAAWKQGKFWELAHDLYEQQDRADLNSIEVLQKMASDHGLDVDLFTVTLASPEAEEFIQAQRKFQKMAFAEKPPTVLMNGFFVKGDLDSMLAKIRELKLIDSE